MNDLELALAAAATGAEIVRSGFGAHTTTIQKGWLDPVTEVDKASEKAIVDLLTEHRPDDGLLGEEGASRASSGRRWIIDPLDGTVNFIHGIPHVSVSVGLWDREQALVGAVVDAMGGEVFAAEHGQGATVDGVPINVSDTTELHRGVIATGFPYDRDQYAKAYATTLGEVLARVNGVRRLGSAALDFCWLAAGRYDAYWEYSLGPWDAAAGVLIAQEAGALITDARGQTHTLESPHLLAATPALHSPLLSIIEPSLPPHLDEQ